jgi:hypothetical protein
MHSEFASIREAQHRPARDPSRRLAASLAALASAQAELQRHRQRPWASITFAGTRHELTLVFSGDEAVAAGEAFIAALPEHEFTVPGHLVADAQVRTVDHQLIPTPRLTVECDILLLEDA